ncbi:NAD-dependent epimerase/dehydratase [Paenibacillus curdlanolyticus YK9]|uniref:NAD-dependent epimerase/dehydratase n=1 Tax=Paenibacillus curdlanolyticus YK9 TaxID=717606 RepID=E0I5V0_9BACL|nr:SDR family oxidoreductase [Paenibacillus curdlanolyticus]EFM12342.1 NAD-dependent epimerase/dehydratase [Paenibacillus curdlanolyticus YK9]
MKRILILGATGRVGQQWVAQALDDGHEAIVLVRDPRKLTIVSDRLTVLQGDVTNPQDLIHAAKRTDAILSALSTDGGTVLSQCAPLLIEAMRQNHIRRLVTVGTAGILNSRTEPMLLRYQSNESRRTLTRAAEEHHQFYKQIAHSGLDWTIVCPTYLPDGEHTGIYRVLRDYLPADGLQISVQDTAAFAYKQLFSAEYNGSRVGIAY